jgi:Domain of unknown function (DUF1707)
MTENSYQIPPMRASDAERDVVVAALGEHFQAGRLTAEELDDRTGKALAARTLPELQELMADLPPARHASPQEVPLEQRPRSTFHPLVVPAMVLVILAAALLALVGADQQPRLLVAVPVAILIARGIARRGFSRRP